MANHPTLGEYLSRVLPQHQAAWEHLDAYLKERPIVDIELDPEGQTFVATLVNGSRVRLSPGLRQGGRTVRSVSISVPDPQTGKYDHPKDGIADLPDSIRRIG